MANNSRTSWPPSPLILFLILAFHTSPCFAVSNNFTANQTLSGNQFIISTNGRFKLGFFSPGNSNPNYYLGIWYAKVPKLTTVWVANREASFQDQTSSQLKFTSDGNLVLYNQFNYIVWSTNTSIPSSMSTVAVLLDSGNFVVSDVSNTSKFYWQSFDHPSDTWLPGGKIIYDKKTKQAQHLISWKNSDDPAPGSFSLALDPSSQYFIFWNSTKIYWSSGVWNGQIFSGVPEMRQNYIYNFHYINNSEQSYFTYSLHSNETITTRFVMDISGQIKVTNLLVSNEWLPFWIQPKEQCQVYAFCGPFGSCNNNGDTPCKCLKGFSQRNKTEWDLGEQSGGCLRNTKLQCETYHLRNDVKKDMFFEMDGMRLPDNAQKEVSARSATDCESVCLSNCSCTAYAYNRTGCVLWYEDLINLEDGYTGPDVATLYLRLAASELASSRTKKGKLVWIVVAIVAGLAVCFAAFCVWRFQRRRVIGTKKPIGGAPVHFRYSELQHVTKNFLQILGEGAFGTVFKGQLPDSTEIAVKKLQGIQQGEKQFRTEVSTIGTIQHVNLIRLFGFCSEGNKRLLVYEYMPNGSLDTQLFQNDSVVIEWDTRFQIAIGIARGLQYLHEKCRHCIIHCDIKPENVLLDASYVPKVADFGLAKLLGRDFSRVLTTMRGTRGYLAPEWITGLPITAKADVYSYGMMLFEIISGRRNLEKGEEGKANYLPALAANKLLTGDVASLLDGKLKDGADLEELGRACKVAYWCIQDDETDRPTMGQVVQVLEGFLDIQMPHFPQTMQFLSEGSHEINFFSDSLSTRTSQTRSTTSQTSQAKSTSASHSGASASS